MSEDEARFCGLVNKTVATTGYSVKDIKLEAGDKAYGLLLKRLGDPEQFVKRFVLFPDQLAESLKTGRLPEGLEADLKKYLA